MSDKELHVVFQVLNFIFSASSEPHNLSSDEKILLIVLARHKGAKGIYPSITTLSHELQRNRRNILRSLKRLNDKKLISIYKDSGRSNHYELSLTSGVDATGVIHATSGVDATTLVTNMVRTSGVDATQSIKINNTKEIIERGRKKRSPISPDFFPDKKTLRSIKELGFKGDECDEIGNAFHEYYLDNQTLSGDWQLMCRNWFRREKKMYRKKKSNGSKPMNNIQPHRNTVSEEPDKYSEIDREQAKREMKKIMEKLNGHGGKHDGILENITGIQKNH